MTVADGTIRCSDGHAIDLSQGFIDASKAPFDDVTRRTFASFGFEWTSFSEIKPEDEEFWGWYFADVDLDELAGRVGLDVGCGNGRFSLFVADHLHALVAMDGSNAVLSAVRNLAGKENAVVLKADLRDPPLVPASFDFVSCLGVLHHLEDPATAFRSLTRLLAPEGLILIYLYSRPETLGVRSAALDVATQLRKLTVHLPHRPLERLSLVVAVVLYGAVVLPGRLGARFGMRHLSSLPLAAYRGRPMRSLWLDTFDRLSAPVEHRFTWSEVRPWFERESLVIEGLRNDHGLIVLARRSADLRGGKT